eukprot:CAMPEP_0201599326 /NCGR_PEP_ID=MMETSP0492-20130828/828_1 /ASSEMBLY_ACC=CAM_ASM_000837 /TAXON_ID=420259 /ORGANISM="Thalassiosira gravida, Strain GMp14c1" /LENGTH=54 /DNA_ID=CAMNT_0048061887 /DNA_START=226 /DNA_END=390 /DNA_ORIENTATION=+
MAAAIILAALHATLPSITAAIAFARVHVAPSLITSTTHGRIAGSATHSIRVGSG